MTSAQRIKTDFNPCLDDRDYKQGDVLPRLVEGDMNALTTVASFSEQDVQATAISCLWVIRCKL